MHVCTWARHICMCLCLLSSGQQAELQWIAQQTGHSICRTFLPVSELNQGPRPKPCLSIHLWFSPYSFQIRYWDHLYTKNSTQIQNSGGRGGGGYSILQGGPGCLHMRHSSVLFYQQEGNSAGLIWDFKGSVFHSLYLKKCTQATMKGDQQCQTQEGSLASRCI